MVQHFKRRSKSSWVPQKVSLTHSLTHSNYSKSRMHRWWSLNLLLLSSSQEFAQFMRELGIKDDAIADRAFAAFNTNTSKAAPYHDIVDGPPGGQ